MPTLHNWSYWAAQIRNLTAKWKYGDWWNWWTNNLPDTGFYTFTTYSWAYDCVDTLITWLTETVWPKVVLLEKTVLSMGDLIVKELYPQVRRIDKELDALSGFVHNTLEKKVNEAIAGLAEFKEYFYETFYKDYVKFVIGMELFEALVRDVWFPYINYLGKLAEYCADEIDMLWNRLDWAWFELIKYIQAVEQNCYQYTEDMYEHALKQVLKWFDDLELKWGGIIEGIRQGVISAKRDVKKVSEFTASAFDGFTYSEQPLADGGEPEGETLAKRTIVKTVTSYGLTLFRELSDFILPTATAEDTARLNQLHIGPQIEKHVSMMDLGSDSEWGDVSDNIDRAIAAMDLGEDPPDLDLNDALLPLDERAERDQAGQWLDAWYDRKL